VAGIVVFLKAVLIALLAAFDVMMVHHNGFMQPIALDLVWARSRSSVRSCCTGFGFCGAQSEIFRDAGGGLARLC
jgi:hypothetical protein